jgi:hypothetical protein
MGKIKLVQIAVAASIDDTWDTLALDDKGRLWRIGNQNEFTLIELPDDPSPKPKEEVEQ